MATMRNLAVSPCSTPWLELDQCLAAYSRLGFRKFEAFTSWCRSAFDIDADPAGYRRRLARFGMRTSSMHLPPVEQDVDATLDRAVRAARFAAACGAGVVLFKAATRPLYIRAAGPFLDAIDGLDITPVLQNHAGTAISTPDDFSEVLAGIGDPRMRTLLEVGQFNSVGVSWKQGCQLLGDSIALVHVKDQVGPKRVPFGEGETDLPGLFAHMRAAGYGGDFVVEIETEPDERRLDVMAAAVEYLKSHCLESDE
jgi:sugar phosphate isomerase/epimerase